MADYYYSESLFKATNDSSGLRYEDAEVESGELEALESPKRNLTDRKPKTSEDPITGNTHVDKIRQGRVSVILSSFDSVLKLQSFPST